jgi:hypothetical protein
MKRCLFIRRSLGLGVAVAAFAAVPAQAASASVDTSMCSAGEFSQPFLSAKDSNWYTLLPGDGVDNFNGSGWELSGGASIQTTTLTDGTTGTVLDLPSGSEASSPTICVMSNYPSARTMVRNVTGAEGVQFFVSYAGTKTWSTPKNTGHIHGSNTSWTVANPVNLQPEKKTEGWQPMRITLIPGGQTSRFDVYNLYIDPRMSH